MAPQSIDENDTPLHYAAKSGYTGVVELLLRNGALTEAINEDNHTPFTLLGKRVGILGL